MEMNLHQVNSNQFTSYSDSSVIINGQEYNTSILVTNTDTTKIELSCVEQLSLNDLPLITANSPDLIILGTGNVIMYPRQEIMYYCYQHGIGIEIMTIQALCRTFNFLVSEDRKVSCVLLFPEVSV